MPHVTTILGNEVGIQYQGTRDASSLTGAAQISGLIVGQFKRGRLDQPMTITLENVKGTLGEDLNNPDYLAVLDALAGGVPSVQVMRVNGGGGDDGASCAWIKSSDFSRVIESWKTDRDVAILAYMDSLDQFNSTIDQIQSMKIDYFESITPEYGPSRLDKIFSIDFSPWLDAIKAKLKEEFSNQLEIQGFEVVKVTVENYSLRDMSAPQPIMDALNALGGLLPYQGTTAYEARVDVAVVLKPTAENQYLVSVLAAINFLNQDGKFLMPAPVWSVVQTCFKGGNIAAFDGKTISKLPDSVLNSLEGTKWLKSQGGFTTIDCIIPFTGGGVIPANNSAY